MENSNIKKLRETEAKEKYQLQGSKRYAVGSKSFRPDQLFKVTEIKKFAIF